MSDIKGDIESAMDAIESREDTPEFEADDRKDQQHAEAAEPEIEEEAPKEEAAAEEAPAETEVEPEEEEQLTAPEHWKAEDRTAFESLSPEGRQVLLSQSKSIERGYNQRIRGFDDKMKEYDNFLEVMQPMQGQLQNAGLDRIAGIRTLLQAQQMLSSNPEAGLQQLLSQYGGNDAREIVTNIATRMGLLNAAPSEAEDYRTPNELAMQQQLDQITQSLNQTQNNAVQQRTNEAQNQITLFSSAEDDSGNLLHPHFEALQTQMGSLINGGHASGLDQAYEQAMWANADLRNELIKAQTAQVAHDQEAARKKTVAKARTASRNPNTIGVAASPPPAQQSRRDTIADLYDLIDGR